VNSNSRAGQRQLMLVLALVTRFDIVLLLSPVRPSEILRGHFTLFLLQAARTVVITPLGGA